MIDVGGECGAQYQAMSKEKLKVLLEMNVGMKSYFLSDLP